MLRSAAGSGTHWIAAIPAANKSHSEYSDTGTVRSANPRHIERSPHRPATTIVAGRAVVPPHSTATSKSGAACKVSDSCSGGVLTRVRLRSLPEVSRAVVASSSLVPFASARCQSVACGGTLLRSGRLCGASTTALVRGRCLQGRRSSLISLLWVRQRTDSITWRLVRSSPSATRKIDDKKDGLCGAAAHRARQSFRGCLSASICGGKARSG